MAVPSFLADRPSPAANHDSGSAPRQSVRWAIAELVSVIVCIEVIMWIVPLMANFKAGYEAVALLIALILSACYIRDGVAARDLGIRFDNMFTVLRRLALPLAVFVLLATAVGFFAGTLRFGPKFYGMLIGVPLWALLQQYMLLAFVNRRLRLILGAGQRSVLGTAALFSFLHLPNPILTIVCAVAGYIWAREYEREPNLFANALTHTIASAFLANSLSHTILKNMVVGYNYFFR